MQNIEQYTLNYINRYWDLYADILDKSKGKDPDYPDLKLNFK